MINLSTVFVLVVHLLGCKPDDVAPEQPPIAPQSPVVWKKPLEIGGLTSTPHYYQGRIIFGHQAKEKNNYLVYCLDAKTGDSIWQTRIVTPFEFEPFDKDMSAIHKNKIVFADSKRMFVLNLDNGEILWNYTDPHNFGGVCIIDGYVYTADAVNRRSATMCRFDINTGATEKMNPEEILPLSSWCP